MSTEDANGDLIFRDVYDIDERTVDVLGEGNFEQLMINPVIVQNLTRHGFHKPSPVQAKAIPLGLLGMDMLVQAKTGTGKTLVFAVMCADQLINAEIGKSKAQPLVMIVSPTREIAMQSYNVVAKVCPSEAQFGLFVGGTGIESDRKRLRRGVHVVVGTGGRLAHLAKCKFLNMKHIGLFILDEADKLMEDNFRLEINYLFSNLTPDLTQTCVFSATYPREIDSLLCDYMKEPSLVRLNSEDIQLVGVKQYAVVDEARSDLDILLSLLKSIVFSQCLIFTNDVKKCSTISEFLAINDINASHISGSLPQNERFSVMKNFRNFRIRVLVSTDLYARGIDAANVNLVINMECPSASDNYLHRVGRAGRFGTRGAALTILANDRELYYFKLLVYRERLKVKLLAIDQPCPMDLPVSATYYENARNFKKIIDEDNVRLAKLRARRLKDEDSDDESDNNAISGAGDAIGRTSCSMPVDGVPKVIVPLRSANSTKYYLRREMLAIRDMATMEEWQEYAKNRFVNFRTPDSAREFAQILLRPTGRKKIEQGRTKENICADSIRNDQKTRENFYADTDGNDIAHQRKFEYVDKPMIKQRPIRDVPRRSRAEYHAYMERLMRELDAEPILRYQFVGLQSVEYVDTATNTTGDEESMYLDNSEPMLVKPTVEVEQYTTIENSDGGDIGTAVDK